MADSTRPELPGVLARMWGREPAPRRGPKPSLDLARITKAATEIADAAGLAAVSMNNIASRLGVAPMSLYRYVGSKEELLLAMLDAAAGEPPSPDGLSRREYLARWARANVDLFVARPWLLSIAERPPLGPRGLLWLERLLAALDDTPLDDNEKILIGTTFSGYARNEGRVTSGEDLAAGDAREARIGFLVDRRRGLLVEPRPAARRDRLPHRPTPRCEHASLNGEHASLNGGHACLGSLLHGDVVERQQRLRPREDDEHQQRHGPEHEARGEADPYRQRPGQVSPDPAVHHASPISVNSSS